MRIPNPKNMPKKYYKMPWRKGQLIFVTPAGSVQVGFLGRVKHWAKLNVRQFL